MKDISSSLCPMRVTKNGLEVFMVRRAFWNEEKQRPMRFPGEWTFAGGKADITDCCLRITAEREFREELLYTGDIKNMTYIHSMDVTEIGNGIKAHFYACKLSADPCKKGVHNPEVEEMQWFKPEEALNLINSECFNFYQEMKYQARQLHLEQYKNYAITERVRPEVTIRTLERIILLPELKAIYSSRF